MPSKGLTVLIVLFVVGSIVGLSRVDFTVDKQRFPPDYGLLAAMGDMPPGPWGGVDPNAKPKVAPGNQPDQADQPDQPDPGPSDEPDDGTNEIRIKGMQLTRLSPEATKQVMRRDSDDFVILKLDKEGSPNLDGVDLGDYALLDEKLMSTAAGAMELDLVIVPEEATPWQYVYWTLEAARKYGVTKVRIGGYPSYDDEKTLLVALDVPLVPSDAEVELNEDMVELVIEVTLDADGKTTRYTVFEEEAAGLNGVFQKASSFNGDYADEFGVDYSRDPSKTPWVVTAPGTTPTGRVLRAMDAVRQAAIYSVRFGGEFPPPPGKK
jgi:biopolymer transport protein ExbD